MSETQNVKNIGWSHGLQGRKSESTTPHLRGCVLELACRRSDRPGRSRNLGNRKSARMQERRASRCAALSFFLVASIGDATRRTHYEVLRVFKIATATFVETRRDRLEDRLPLSRHTIVGTVARQFSDSR